LQTRKWQDKDGNDRYTTEVIINEMQMLGDGGKADGNNKPQQSPQQQSQQQAPRQQAPQQSEPSFDDSEIPF
jgi:single-strand DNA-binding protein